MRHRIGRKSDADKALIAQHPDGWQLWLQAQAQGWANIHLFQSVRSPGKVSFWLAWSVSGHRLARSMDAAKLEGYHPNIHRWVTTSMQNFADLGQDGALGADDAEAEALV